MPKAIIIGGGIGGLAAAVALDKVGWEVEVYERSPEIREVGAGLSLWCNAMHALDRLGVFPSILACSTVLDVTQTVTAAGKPIVVTDLTQFAQQTGYPTVCVHRADLQRILLQALPMGVVHTGMECQTYTMRPDGITVRFVDGREVDGDILIGADGIRSAVRATFADPGLPRYAGYTAWRGIGPSLPPDQSPNEAWFAMGTGTQIGILPCGPGRVYWFIAQNAPAGGTDPVGERRSTLLSAFSRWHPGIGAVIEATDEAAIIRNDIYDRPPSSNWGRDRVTMLGDAIHATTPNLGQGACMALEDAVFLAHQLRESPDPVVGLRQYEAARQPRTAFVIRQSWTLGKMFQLENRTLSWLRNRFLATRFAVRQGDAVLQKLLTIQLPRL